MSPAFRRRLPSNATACPSRPERSGPAVLKTAGRLRSDGGTERRRRADSGQGAPGERPVGAAGRNRGSVSQFGLGRARAPVRDSEAARPRRRRASRSAGAVPAWRAVGDLDQRRRVAELDGLAAFRHVVEEGEELVELLLRDRVVLVVVAAGAADRQAEPDGGGGLDAVDDVLDGVLLGDDAALGVAAMVAVEAGGDLLVERRVAAAGRRRAARW